LDQFLLIQFQFFVVVCELNTAAYQHGRQLHRKSADFLTGSENLTGSQLILTGNAGKSLPPPPPPSSLSMKRDYRKLEL